MPDKTTRRVRVVDPGYRVPDVQPETFLCARVYIPNDVLYIAAFWGVLQTLTTWLAWERGGTKAKTAAELWKAAWELSRGEWDKCAGECGVVDVRQKPDEPCVLQKKIDCDTWEDFATITDCTQALPVPFQTDSEDEVNDALWAVKETIEQVNLWLVDGKSATEIKYLLSGLGIAGINQLVDDMAAMDAEDRQDAIDNFDWQVLKDDVWCRDNSCSMAGYTLPGDVYEWTICMLSLLEDWSAETAGAMADWAADLINDIVPASFLSLLNMFPGGGEGFSFDETVCPWEHTFDFTVSDCGFDALTINGYAAGEWVEGIGWRGVYTGTQGGDGAYHISIKSDVISPDADFTKGQFIIDYDEDERYYRNFGMGLWADGNWQGGFVMDGGSYSPPPVSEGVFEGEASMTGDQVSWKGGNTHSGSPQPDQGVVGGVTLSSMTVYGTGDNPWE